MLSLHCQKSNRYGFFVTDFQSGFFKRWVAGNWNRSPQFFATDCCSISAPRGFIVLYFFVPLQPICWHDMMHGLSNDGLLSTLRGATCLLFTPSSHVLWLDRCQDSQFVNVKDVFAIGLENWLFRLCNDYPWRDQLFSRNYAAPKKYDLADLISVVKQPKGIPSSFPIIAYAKKENHWFYCPLCFNRVEIVKVTGQEYSTKWALSNQCVFCLRTFCPCSEGTARKTTNDSLLES